jgi:hypothetical protein
MIVTRLTGGLGNQMFQYAAGRALALRLGVPLKLDISWFAEMSTDTPREYMLHAFPIAAAEARHEEIESVAYCKRPFLSKVLRRPKQRSAYYIREPSFSYWPGFTALAAPAYLAGYWQQEQYFSDIADVIRRDFAFPPFNSPEAAELAAEIASSPDAVCVHIRRGDYVTSPVTSQYHGVCAPAYYEKALQMLAAKLGSALRLFLFTDEPVWVREHFDTRGYPATVIDFPEHQDKPWHDMHLMSLGAHHVIANSSFSWWGAWLADGTDRGGITIAPERWFALEDKQHDTPVPSRWITI